MFAEPKLIKFLVYELCFPILFGGFYSKTLPLNYL